MRFGLLAIIVTVSLLACSGESLVYVGEKSTKPSGVTEYGWDNWNGMAATEQAAVCNALRSMNNLEIPSIQLAIESGADVPARPKRLTPRTYGSSAECQLRIMRRCSLRGRDKK